MSSDSIQNGEIKDAFKLMHTPRIKTDTSKIPADFVTHFMKERDYPTWYRGLSFCQMNSADSLLNNIRDDSEQNTTHRVRETLQKLGIHPLVSPRRIRLAMRLSQGNDIAFLWFLMELYYIGAAHKKGEYSVNEQIVMTAIAHLDAIPTLRELDRLLPKQADKPSIVKRNKGLKKNSINILPYFEKQVRPMFFGRKLTLKEANNFVNLEYESYLNQNCTVPNESNRWYTSYELSDSKRIAKWIMNDQLKTIFSTDSDQTVVETSLSKNPDLIRMDTCQKCFDIQEGAKKKASKRITTDFKSRVEEAEVQLQRTTKPILNARKICTPSCVRRENGKVSFELIGVHSAKSLDSKLSITEGDGNFDFGHSDVGHTKHIYFQGPTHYTAYKFNYTEIFEQGWPDLIKESSHYNLCGYCRGSCLDHSECIKKECKKLWNTLVENTEYRSESLETKELLKGAKCVKDGLYRDIRYYDPNDQDLMSKMLQDAIKEMRNSKKYILVTFPDAHKTPFLKEFIKKRYGFVYTRNSKRSSFKQSKEVFHVLNRTEIRAKVPTSDDVAANRVVSYAYKNYIKTKTNFLKAYYNHNFKVSLMEHARNYWGAVRPYQCSNGPPRNEFFAYLPSRENDIHMFRPWKVDEYIRAKQEWDKRQRIERNKLFAGH